MIVRQVFYQLSRAINLFCVGFFRIVSPNLFAQAGFELSSSHLLDLCLLCR
jgi:hypothetical protein